MDTYEQIWHNAPDELLLAENEVHVWRASLKVLTGSIEHLEIFLLEEEIQRAQRFFFEKDRLHWTVARAVLRRLLARYLKVDPRSLRFTTNDYGKPSIEFPLAGRRLHFNLSHSNELALYAFAYERELGVDVEYMRGNLELDDMARHHFSSREYAALRALPAELREEAFFLCWSRKEAYIKARGKGLSLPLDRFDVSLLPGEPAALLESREEPQVAERWLLRALSPGMRYAGALVGEGSGWQHRCWQWQE